MQTTDRWFGPAAIAALCLGGMAPTPCFAPPFPLSSNTPGPPLGELRSRWLLPYVRYTVESAVVPGGETDPCCRIGSPSVRWYAEDGAVLRDVRGAERGGGYVRFDRRIYGLWPFYEMAHPQRKGVESGFIGASPTGRVVLRAHYPRLGEECVDRYENGRLDRTYGPFERTRRQPRLHVQRTGAFCLEISPRAADSTRVVRVDPTGDVTGNFVVEGVSPHAAIDPRGRGVVLDARGRGAKLRAVPGIDPVSLDVHPGTSHVVGWVGENALFSERPEEGTRWSLVRLETGRRLWHGPAPVGLPGSDGAVVASGDWVYLYDREFSSGKEHESGGHKISVIDTESGTTRHVWRSFPSIPPPRPCRLVELGGDVHFVTDTEFSRLDRSIIESRQGGWADPDA